MRMKTITIWQNSAEGWVEFTEKGKTIRFDTAFEIIEFIRKKTANTDFKLRIEQV